MDLLPGSWILDVEDCFGVLAQSRLLQPRLCRLVAEVDRGTNVPAARWVLAHHAAGDKIRMAHRLRQCVDAPVADVDRREIGIPFCQRFFAKFGGKKIHDRLLMGTWSPQAEFGEIGSAHGLEEVADELRLLAG